MNFSFERYQWITTPDGKLILVDSWTSQVVENAPTYETSNATSTANTKNTKNEDKQMSKKECAFCGKEIVGYGNNPAPFTNKGEVCDECNSKYVIPARLKHRSAREDLFEPLKKYVIEVRLGEYVKNSKYDTKNLLDAKFFDSEKTAKSYISRNLPYGANIKLVKCYIMKGQMLTTFQQRLKNETQELAVKINKLQDYMRTEQFYSLTRNEKDMLYMQLHSMLTYLEVLGKRCEYYDIKLDIKEINK